MVKAPAILNKEPFIKSPDNEFHLLRGIRSVYLLPKDPLVEEVLIPGFRTATSVDCMVGFFSSEVLVSLAPGLATYIASSQNKFRLIISPFLRSQDREAIEKGFKSEKEVADDIMEKLIVTEDLLQRHTLKCLSWLIRENRIEIRIALMKDALFHPKVWLFRNDEDTLAVHGSSNMTYSGIQKNIENISVSKSWEDPNQRHTADKYVEQFHNFWENKEDYCTVIPVSRAIQQRIVRNYRSSIPPSEEELRVLYKQATEISEEPETYETLPPVVTNLFAIPEELRFEDGPFEHQGKAVEAWCEAGYCGILEMATGSGKTITSMICAYRLYEAHKPLLIVVSAPYIPLIQQWCDEIEFFGLRPVNLSRAAGRRGRAKEINKIKRRLQNDKSKVEIVVVSHRTLCDSSFSAELEKFKCARLLIADEAHNLGSEGFILDPPTFFEYKLGLSATPVRQYDEEGTAGLFAFFGSVVFQFTLKEAIGRCLVEYDYFLHPVELTADEMEEWYDLTARIKANAWRQENNKSDEYLMKLLRDRRALLETARNKIAVLKTALDLDNIRKLRHTLIYTSDKGPEQIKEVNALLQAEGALFHQLTHEETADQEKTAEIIRSFREGTLRILTAKRVLDEGVNIPEIQKAFILASTTVERQWVQRRGRLLRNCREIGKTHSEIHDFIALPPDLEMIDEDARNLVRTELLRVQEFASLARNAGRAGGPLETVDKLVNMVFT